MPVPSVPRRAAPPRKKPAKPSAPPPSIPEPETEDVKSETPSEAVVPTEIPLPQSPPQNREAAEATLVTEPSVSPPALEVASSPEEAAPAKVAGERDKEADGKSEETPQVVQEKAQQPVDEEPSAEPPVAVVEEKEEEVDEEEKRRRVAERISRMGGINPFAAPLPPRRQSTLSAKSQTEEPTTPPITESTESKEVSTPAVAQTITIAKSLEVEEESPTSREELSQSAKAEDTIVTSVEENSAAQTQGIPMGKAIATDDDGKH